MSFLCIHKHRAFNLIRYNLKTPTTISHFCGMTPLDVLAIFTWVFLELMHCVKYFPMTSLLLGNLKQLHWQNSSNYIRKLLWYSESRYPIQGFLIPSYVKLTFSNVEKTLYTLQMQFANSQSAYAHIYAVANHHLGIAMMIV